MGYHIDTRYAEGHYDELPSRILMMEDGWLGAYKFEGIVPTEHWYVPESRLIEAQAKAERYRSLIDAVAPCLDAECVRCRESGRECVVRLGDGLVAEARGKETALVSFAGTITGVEEGQG